MHFVCLCARRYLGSELPDILNKRTHHQMRTDTCTQKILSVLLAGSSLIYIRFMFIFLFFYLDASALLFPLFAKNFQIRPTCPTSRSVSSRSDSRTSDGHPWIRPSRWVSAAIPSLCWPRSLESLPPPKPILRSQMFPRPRSLKPSDTWLNAWPRCKYSSIPPLLPSTPRNSTPIPKRAQLA